MMTDPIDTLSLAVPAYFHPAVLPRAWQTLEELGRELRMVVINVDSGPGDEPDTFYQPVVASLRAAGVRLVGYVDTAYGRRSPAVIAREMADYQRWYGIRGIFMDQVSAGLEDLDHYAQCVVAARTAGAQFVALNPGTHPHPGYVDLANVTVTFEGTWMQYLPLAVPDWVDTVPASRLCHLVHSLPPDEYGAGLQLAARRNVGSVFLTEGRGDNPWNRLPLALLEELSLARANGQPR